MKKWWVWMLIAVFFGVLAAAYDRTEKEKAIVMQEMPKNKSGKDAPEKKHNDLSTITLILQGMGLLSGAKSGWELAEKIKKATKK